MTNPTPAVLDRALRLLGAIIADDTASALGPLATRLGIPTATAYRLAGALIEHGYVVRVRPGIYFSGPVIVAAGFERDPVAILRRNVKPWLDWVASKSREVTHLGVFDDGMVSYLLKTGSSRSARYTRKDTQLDAYCTGLGKVLLAYMPLSERTAYLAGGPFPKLTNKTISDPSDLMRQLRQVRKQAYAVDDCEFADDLKCVAVPVRDGAGVVSAALSISTSPDRLRGKGFVKALSLLRHASKQIQAGMSVWNHHTTRTMPLGLSLQKHVKPERASTPSQDTPRKRRG
jgi:IclR family acetate operon transcriptional repressor